MGVVGAGGRVAKVPRRAVHRPGAFDSPRVEAREEACQGHVGGGIGWGRLRRGPGGGGRRRLRLDDRDRGPHRNAIGAPLEEARHVTTRGIRERQRVDGAKRQGLVVGVTPLLPHADVSQVLLVPQADGRRLVGPHAGREAAVERAHVHGAPAVVRPYAREVGQRPAVDRAKREAGVPRGGRRA